MNSPSTCRPPGDARHSWTRDDSQATRGAHGPSHVPRGQRTPPSPLTRTRPALGRRRPRADLSIADGGAWGLCEAYAGGTGTRAPCGGSNELVPTSRYAISTHLEFLKRHRDRAPTNMQQANRAPYCCSTLSTCTLIPSIWSQLHTSNTGVHVQYRYTIRHKMDYFQAVEGSRRPPNRQPGAARRVGHPREQDSGQRWSCRPIRATHECSRRFYRSSCRMGSKQLPRLASHLGFLVHVCAPSCTT